MRSATRPDCVGAPPGELISKTTACNRSCPKALVNTDSTVVRLIVPRANGDGLGVITPCSLTTATTSLRSPRSPIFGIRAAKFSITLIDPTLPTFQLARIHVLRRALNALTLRAERDVDALEGCQRHVQLA